MTELGQWFGLYWYLMTVFNCFFFFIVFCSLSNTSSWVFGSEANLFLVSKIYFVKIDVFMCVWFLFVWFFWPYHCLVRLFIIISFSIMFHFEWLFSYFSVSILFCSISSLLAYTGISLSLCCSNLLRVVFKQASSWLILMKLFSFSCSNLFQIAFRCLPFHQ